MKKSDRTEVFEGLQNLNLEHARGRLIRGGTYRDLSTIMLVPSRGQIPVKVVQSWLGLMTPMNQKFFRIFLENMEVGDAYNTGVKTILENAELSKWRYVLTVEEDNAMPPDGLLRLYEGIAKFDAVGGLYWTKHENGQPMIYGNVSEMPRNFVPQLPQPDCLQECCGLGMGFTLFKLDMFKKMPAPWFRTLQEYTPGQGGRAATQDLFFFQEAAKFGYRFACDTRVRVGHYDSSTGTMW
jgi:hypothetical protein